MCVEDTGRIIKGPVTAWKIMARTNGRLYGIRHFYYKIDKLYTSDEPGFQAFVKREDAEFSAGMAWGDCFVRKVILYGAAKGTIRNMDCCSNGRPGWKAKKIRISRKMK